MRKMVFSLLALLLAGLVLLACQAATSQPARPPGLRLLEETRPDGAVRLTDPPAPASDQNPALSPDGTRLLFTRFTQGYNDGPAGLYLLDWARLEITPLLVEPDVDNVNLPGSAWNAATDRITFASDRQDIDEVWKMAAAGGNLLRVTHHDPPGYFIEPSLSPDGQWIVFETDTDAPDEQQQGSLWKVRADGTGLTQLTDGPGGDTDDRQPNWSPAGDRILFQRRTPGSDDWNLYTMAPDENDVQTVTSVPSSDTDASWAPDGRWIVYSSDYGGLPVPNIFVIPSKGGAPIRVTHDDTHEDGAPSWSPNGEWIAFESHQGETAPASLWRIAVPNLSPGLGYPRLANYWCGADVLSTTLELAQWDVVILLMDTQAYTDTVFDLDDLRMANPDIVLLAYLDPVEVNLNAFEYDPENHDIVEHELIQEIDGGWWLLEPGSVLSEDVDAFQTEIPVADTSAFTAWLTPTQDMPEPEPAYVLVDDEHMRVLEVLSETLVVSRGIYSAPAAHLGGTRIATHIVYWPGMWVLNLTDDCPEDDAGQRWNTFLPQWLHDEVMATGLWDGLYYDCVWGSISWAQGGKIDADNDGGPDDPDALDAAWRGGLDTMLETSRSLEGTGVPIVGNAEPTSPYYGSLNGILNEQFPFLHGWNPTMAGYFTWNTGGWTPVLNVVDASPPNLAAGEPDPYAETNYRWMRFGLTSALLGDGYYGYDGGDWDHMELWWYDEYDNVGQGKGYLGQPLGPAVELDAVVVAHDRFEGGDLGPYVLGPAGSLTSEPGEVIEGNYSIKGSVVVSSTQWIEYLESDPDLLSLTPGMTYTVEFDYRVLAGSLNSSFYFLAWSETGDDERGNFDWYDLPGAEGVRRITFTLGPYDDYALMWGIEYTGTVIVDDIRLLAGLGGVWRRDFEGGIALVNPTVQTRTVDLGGTFRKIAGVQDPQHNDGSLVTAVAVPARDGYVLLREGEVHRIFLPLVVR